MRVHLVDGTYELFRHFFALPEQLNAAGEQVAAVSGVVGSILGMLEGGATHVGVATDHVIESFRNELWSGYKTGRASTRVSGHSSIRWRMRSGRSVSRSGPWWSSRPTMPSRRLPTWPPRIRESRKS